MIYHSSNAIFNNKPKIPSDQKLNFRREGMQFASTFWIALL